MLMTETPPVGTRPKHRDFAGLWLALGTLFGASLVVAAFGIGRSFEYTDGFGVTTGIHRSMHRDSIFGAFERKQVLEQPGPVTAVLAQYADVPDERNWHIVEWQRSGALGGGNGAESSELEHAEALESLEGLRSLLEYDVRVGFYFLAKVLADRNGRHPQLGAYLLARFAGKDRAETGRLWARTVKEFDFQDSPADPGSQPGKKRTNVNVPGHRSEH